MDPVLDLRMIDPSAIITPSGSLDGDVAIYEDYIRMFIAIHFQVPQKMMYKRMCDGLFRLPL